MYVYAVYVKEEYSLCINTQQMEVIYCFNYA